MCRFRWCTAAAALGVCCAALPASALAAPAPSPLPAGLVWVQRGPGDDVSTLHRVTASGAVTSTPLGFAVNAVGCAADGAVFGLAASRAGRKLRSGPHVVRIGGDGRVTDLGAVPAAGHVLADGYGGTVVAADGRVQLLVVTPSAVRPVQVAPGPPRLLAARKLPPLPYVGDWVVEPGSGDLLAVAARDGRAQLVRLAPGATKPVWTPLPAVLPGRSAYGALALHPDGTLTALFNQSAGPGAGPGTGRAPAGSALFRIPFAHPERAAKVADLGAVTSSDATTCPVPTPVPPRSAAVPVPPVVPPPLEPPRLAAVPVPPVQVSSPSAVVASPAPPVARVAGVPGVSLAAPVAVPTTGAPGPVPPPTARPRPQVRRATPPPGTGAPAVSSARRPNLRPAPVPVSVVSPARSAIGKRFIPVVGGFMIVAVAMTRLLRRGR